MEYSFCTVMFIYAVIIAILAVGGYFTVKYIKITEYIGAAFGVVLGIVTSIALWYAVGKNMVKKA